MKGEERERRMRPRVLGQHLGDCGVGSRQRLPVIFQV